jgi:uncharacterized repeat protein (TIGR03803 family)
MSRNRKRLSTLEAVMLVVIIVIPVLSPSAWAQSKYRTLYAFTGGKDGSSPVAGLVFDQAGNLYGTTIYGGDQGLCNFNGASGCGVVFKLTPNSNGGWKEAVLHTFIDHPGANPVAGLIFGAGGNLYGTTEGDGTTTHGSVFEITP